MYTVAVKRDFVAQHFLIGGDWGPENSLHSHHYGVEIRLEGNDLDEHGFLVDIVEIEKNLNEIIGYFSDKTLNELPEFEGLNPSIEHFSRIFCNIFAERVETPNITAITVVMEENQIAWASFRKSL